MTPLFIFGTNRSGTNMLAWSLGRAPGVHLYNEDHPDAFRNFLLREPQVIAEIIRANPSVTCIFKSIVDSFQADWVLDTFSALGIFIFRRVESVVSSLMNEFGPPGIAVIRQGLQDILDRRSPMLGDRADGIEELIRPLIADYFREPLNDQSVAALFWLCLHRFAFSVRLHRDPRCLFVAYEKMAAAPEPELRRVCAFADLTYDPSMTRGVKESNRLAPAADIVPSLLARCHATEAALLRVAVAPPGVSTMAARTPEPDMLSARKGLTSVMTDAARRWLRGGGA